YHIDHYILLNLFLLYFFYCSGHHRDLHSFPTRRSSDLISPSRLSRTCWPSTSAAASVSRTARARSPRWRSACSSATRRRYSSNRSEEHTSELQSRGHLVCRLLLEKKKQNQRKSYKALLY